MNIEKNIVKLALREWNENQIVVEAVLFWPNAYTRPILTTCDVITGHHSHLNHAVTCLATMSSLMRMKSTRWSAAMPNAVWMLCKSAAMSGSVEDSIQRWLQRVHRHTLTTSRTISIHLQTLHWSSSYAILTSWCHTFSTYPQRILSILHPW